MHTVITVSYKAQNLGRLTFRMPYEKWLQGNHEVFRLAILQVHKHLTEKFPIFENSLPYVKEYFTLALTESQQHEMPYYYGRLYLAEDEEASEATMKIESYFN